MKKLTLIITILSMVCCFSLSAQKKNGFKGVIKYTYHYEGEIDANLLSQLPKESEEVICGNYLKQNVSGITQITNADDQIVYLLFDFPVGAYYISVPKDSIENKRKNMKYDYNYTDDRKNIAGYDCQKVILSVTNLETDDVIKSELFVSEKINSNPDINFENYPGLKGFPLAATQTQELDGAKIVIKSEALSITENKKLKEQEFWITSRFQEVKSVEELRAKLGM